MDEIIKGMSRVNEIKGYIRGQQAKIDQLSSNDKILLGCMIDELRQEYGIETIVGGNNTVTFRKALTDTGRKILAQCPGKQSNGISEHNLIVERLHAGSGYADYQRMIQELVETGYLVRDPATQRITRV